MVPRAELSNGSASALHYVQSRDIAAAADKQFQISSNSSMKEFGSILTWQGANHIFYFIALKQQISKITTRVFSVLVVRSAGLVSSSTFILLLDYMLWSQGKQILTQYICVRSVVYLRNTTQEGSAKTDK